MLDIDTLVLSALIALIVAIITSLLTHILTKWNDIYRMKNEVIFKRITEGFETLVKGLSIITNGVDEAINIVKEGMGDNKTTILDEQKKQRIRDSMDKGDSAMQRIVMESSHLSLYLCAYESVAKNESIQFGKLYFEFGSYLKSEITDIGRLEDLKKKMDDKAGEIEKALFGALKKYEE